MQFIEAKSEYASSLMGHTPTGVMDMLKARVQSYMQTNGNTGFAKELYNKFTDVASGARFQAIQAIKKRYNRVFKSFDGIQYLQTFEDVQAAPASMVNLIMANPLLKKLYREESIEGYGDRYDGKYANVENVYDPNFRKVTDGLSVKIDDKIVISSFFEGSGVTDLTTMEKLNVLSIWDRVPDWVEQGIDVTSEDNNPIA